MNSSNGQGTLFIGWRLILVLLAVSVCTATVFRLLPLPDLKLVYLKGASALLHGSNPYVPLASQDMPLDTPERLRPLPGEPLRVFTLAPPACLVPILPFTFIPEAWVNLVYISSAIFILLYSIFTLSKLLGLSSRNMRFPALLISSACILPFGLFAQCVQWGNPSWLVLAAVIFFVQAWTADRKLLAGLLLSVGIVKPNLLFIIAILVIAVSLKLRDYKTVTGLFLGALAFIVIPITLNSKIYLYYFAAQSQLETTGITTSSLPSFLYAQEGLKSAYILYGPFIIGILLSVILILSYRVYDNILYTLIKFMPLVLPLSPYAWSYDLLLCLPWNIYLLAEDQDSEISLRARIIRFVILLLLGATNISVLYSTKFWLAGVIFWPVSLIYSLLGLLTWKYSKLEYRNLHSNFINPIK